MNVVNRVDRLVSSSKAASSTLDLELELRFFFMVKIGIPFSDAQAAQFLIPLFFVLYFWHVCIINYRSFGNPYFYQKITYNFK